MEGIRAAARSGIAGRPPGFDAAYAAYRTARKQVVADPFPPPAEYGIYLSPADRKRVWELWDDPRLEPEVDALREQVLAWGRNLEALGVIRRDR